MDATAGTCACGARLVGPPRLEPPSPKPMLGAAVLSVVCAALSVTALWFRPSLAFAILAILAAVFALRSARSNPKRFGGSRTASTGFALGCAALVGIGSLWASEIPRSLERSREQQAAATRAEMYRVSSQMIAYRARFGAYPSRIAELRALEEGLPVDAGRDGWDHRIVYASFTSGIASKGRKPLLNANFELRSPGPDGVTNTPDDIVMRDGQIVDAAAGDRSPVGRLPVKVPVSNRIR